MPRQTSLSAAARLILLAVGLGAAGCGKWNVRDTAGWEKLEKIVGYEPEQPTRLVAIWTDTILNHDGQEASRGFGGRLMFYAKDPAKPIKIAGELVVYGFDEANRDPSNPVPDRKFVFPKEQLAKMYSKSDLGHSYSVWLPWDAAGGPQREISLLARFTPVRGSVIVSEQSRHLLPGTSSPVLEQAAATARQLRAAGKYDVQQASFYEAPAGGAGQLAEAVPLDLAAAGATLALSGQLADGKASGRRMSTTTIPVPSRSGLQNSPRPNGVRAAAPARPETDAPTVPSGVRSAASGPLRTPAANSGTAPTTPTAGRARFGPARSRPLGAPLARLERDHDPWQPRPVERPSLPTPPLPPATPSAAYSSGSSDETAPR